MRFGKFFHALVSDISILREEISAKQLKSFLSLEMIGLLSSMTFDLRPHDPKLLSVITLDIIIISFNFCEHRFSLSSVIGRGVDPWS